MVSIKTTAVLGLLLAIGWTIQAWGETGPPDVPPGSHTALIPPWFAFNIGCKLHELFSFLAFVTKPPDAYVLDLATSYWNSEVAYALTKNRILDCVEEETAASGGSVSCETVADKLKLQAFVVCRYMESGKNLHLLTKDEPTKGYSLTPHGALLTDTGDLRDFMLMINGNVRFAWRAITTDLMKDGGKPERNGGWEIAFGKGLWPWLREHPEEEAEFDGAMKSLNPTATGAMILDWVPPSKDAKFCDIGGGVGSMLGEVLKHYPEMTGIVFDRHEVVDRARSHLESLGVGGRAEVVGGSFFDEELPEKLANCDIFNLRYILHDWDDDSNVAILRNIRNIAKNSTNKDSKKVVVVMDQIIDTGAHSFFETAKSMMAINMIANNPYGARERSIQEHVDLFKAAGYENITLGKNSAISFVPLRTIESIVQVKF